MVICAGRRCINFLVTLSHTSRNEDLWGRHDERLSKVGTGESLGVTMGMGFRQGGGGAWIDGDERS